MPLRFGLKLSQDATIEQLRTVWLLADSGGFDSCWVMDHFASIGGPDDRPVFEAWTQLAAMAVLTSRVRVGCAVVGNSYRNPGVLAKAAVTVDHLSGGRLDFGIGAGWSENEHTMLGLPFGSPRERADRFEESVQILRSLWTQPRTTFEGEQYHLLDAVAEPKPVQKPYPPIWIGGSGPKRTLRVAARYADVWDAGGSTPEEITRSAQILAEHCADIGRDPAQIGRSVQLPYAGDLDALLVAAEQFLAVGVTDVLLVLLGDDPVALSEQLARDLPRLREIG